MKPIRSYESICKDYGLNTLQADLLQSLVHRRRGVLHPYWIQLAFYMPSGRARRLHDELVANEWATPDEVEIDGKVYETKLTNEELDVIATIQIQSNE